MTNFTKKSSMPQLFIFLIMNETFSAFMFNGHNHTKSHGIYHRKFERKINVPCLLSIR